MRMSYVMVLGLSLLGAGWSSGARADQLPGTKAAEVQGQVQSRLQKDADLKNNQIQATVDNGVVTLRGTVDTDEERAKAGRLARVSGVNKVDNQLKVGSEGARNTVTDSTITARLKTELLAEDALRSVHVETNNAVVSLNGTVPSEAARTRAIDLARSTSGVSRVEDNLKVAQASTN